MNVRLARSDLPSRNAKVKRFLKPVANQLEDLYVVPKSNVPDEFVLAVHGKGFDSKGNFSSLRFRTVSDGFFGMYYERWRRSVSNSKEFFYLYRSYLHIYQISGSFEETEFVLLHCDPNEPETAPHSIYKRSVHLHIESGNASPPHNIWPKAHLGLNVAHVSECLKGEQEFTVVFSSAVKMLREQVLDLLK